MKKIIKGLLVAGMVLSVASVGTLANSVEANAAVSVSASSTTEKINALIKEKQEIILKKKTSTDWREQKALGIRIGEIEREIAALKAGNQGSTTTPGASNEAKIQALITKKMELVAQKKVSRDKAEQKALGKQIDAIEKEIKQLKKNS